jgi:hypothetical protein
MTRVLTGPQAEGNACRSRTVENRATARKPAQLTLWSPSFLSAQALFQSSLLQLFAHPIPGVCERVAGLGLRAVRSVQAFLSGMISVKL